MTEQVSVKKKSGSVAYHALHCGTVQCPKCGRIGSLRLRGPRYKKIYYMALYYQVDHYGPDGNSRSHEGYFGCCTIGSVFPKRNRLADFVQAIRRMESNKKDVREWKRSATIPKQREPSSEELKHA